MRFSEEFRQRKFLAADQRSHALRGVARNHLGEEFIGQEQGVDPVADLRQEPVGLCARRAGEEYGGELEAAAKSFFYNAQAFDGAMAIRCQLAPGKGFAQLFLQGIDQRVQPGRQTMLCPVVAIGSNVDCHVGT